MTTPKDKYRVMKDLDLREVSLVVEPMQTPARVAILKAANPDAVHKSLGMTTVEEGHQHVVVAAYADESRTVEVRYGTTSYVDGHTHEWVRDDAGNITIGVARGHTHSVSVTKAGEPGGAAEMTEEQLKKALADQAAQLAEIQKTAERQGKVLALTAAERAHFDTLKGAEADAFLALSVAGRTEAVEKAAAADPVVFTAPDGTEYRKSDDQRLVKMARDNAAQVAELEKERQLRKQAELVKRAQDELPNLGGEVTAKAALLGVVDTLPETEKGQVLSMLKAHDAGLGKAFQRVGSTTGSDVTKSAGDQLDDMAKAYAAEHKVDMAKAYDAVVRTEKGAALYQEHRAR